MYFLKLLYLRANKIIVNSRDIKQDIIKNFFIRKKISNFVQPYFFI